MAIWWGTVTQAEDGGGSGSVWKTPRGLEGLGTGGGKLLRESCRCLAEGQPTQGMPGVGFIRPLQTLGTCKGPHKGRRRQAGRFKHTRQGSAPRLATFQRLAPREGREEGVSPGR